MTSSALTALDTVREQQFPLTRDTTYLNCAAISPLPRRTVEIMQVANEKLMLDPAGSFEGFFMPQMADFGEAIRKLINARDVSEITFSSSTSLGLSSAALALDWRAGDNVVLCDLEFPSNVYCWMKLEAPRGVETRIIPNRDGGLTVEALREAVDSRTKVVAVSGVQFFSGHRADLMAIGAFCKERDILLTVDAIQCAGHIPLDVQAMNIAIMASGGQKSLMGPIGSGFLYVRGDLAERMTPAFIGANAVEDYLFWLNYDMTPAPGAARFASGSFNITGMIALLQSIKLIDEIGVSQIDQYTVGLVDYAIEQLETAGHTVITPASHGPIFTFSVPEGEDAAVTLMERLKAQRIFVTKHWDKQKNPYIRVSVHCFNNVTDIDHLMEVLKEKSQ